MEPANSPHAHGVIACSRFPAGAAAEVPLPLAVPAGAQDAAPGAPSEACRGAPGAAEAESKSRTSPNRQVGHRGPQRCWGAAPGPTGLPDRWAARCSRPDKWRTPSSSAGANSARHIHTCVRPHAQVCVHACTCLDACVMSVGSICTHQPHLCFIHRHTTCYAHMWVCCMCMYHSLHTQAHMCMLCPPLDPCQEAES